MNKNIKKLATCAMALMFATSLVACGNNTKPTNNGSNKENVSNLKIAGEMTKDCVFFNETKCYKIFRNYETGKDKIENQVKYIEFVKNIPNLDSYKLNETKWDVSAKQDESIMVWFDKNAEKLYFSGNGVIQAPKNSYLGIQDGLFSDYRNVECIKFNGLFDTSKAEYMDYMFFNCNKLKTLDVSNWDVSNLKDAQAMFCGCKSLEKLDLSNWDVSNMTHMVTMFEGCEKLKSLDVANWNTSNVTHMNAMFSGCKSLKEVDVSKWDTSKVGSSMIDGIGTMVRMFKDCASLQQLDLSNWDVSNVGSFYEMFRDCTKLKKLDISNWDVSNADDMHAMFWGCESLQSLDVINWDVSNIYDMDWMFAGCEKLENLDVSKWNVKEHIIEYADSFGIFENCPAGKNVSWIK